MSKIKPRPKAKHTAEFKTQAVNLFLSQNKPVSDLKSCASLQGWYIGDEEIVCDECVAQAEELYEKQQAALAV